MVVAEAGAIKNTNSKAPDYILINNKIDLNSNIDQSLINNLTDNQTQIEGYFSVSCMTGQGVSELKSWIVKKYFIDGVN